MATKRSLSLLAMFVGMAACIATALTAPARPVSSGEGDVALYRAIAGRVHGGESYYDAAHAELLARHYGLRSPLNWRTPTLAYLVALPPTPWLAKYVLVAISAVTVVLAVRLVKRHGGVALALPAALLLPSALLLAVIGDTYLFTELWAGVLILLSVLLFTRHPTAAAVAAVAALFVRELAALYVLVLLLRSSRSRRAVLVLVWGLAAYGGFYLYHRYQVHARIVATDPAYPSGYLTLQGLPFLLATARQSIYLLALPLWVTAVYLPVAVFGLFHLPVPLRQVATPAALAYLVLFAAFGKPFNDYWGLLVAPVLGVSFVFGILGFFPRTRCAVTP